MNTPGSFEYVPEDYFRALKLAKVFPRAGRMDADMGCGDGAFLVAMAQRNLGAELFGNRADCMATA
jgi:tRNA G46 methylase TrmB